MADDTVTENVTIPAGTFRDRLGALAMTMAHRLFDLNSAPDSDATEVKASTTLNGLRVTLVIESDESEDA